MAENMALFGSKIIAKKEGGGTSKIINFRIFSFFDTFIYHIKVDDPLRGGAHQRSSTFASFLFLILLYTATFWPELVLDLIIKDHQLSHLSFF